MNKFQNTPNTLIKGINGEEIWYSRSVVCNIIVLDSSNNILVCLRGQVEDSCGWKLIKDCGYMYRELGSRRHPIDNS